MRLLATQRGGHGWALGWGWGGGEGVGALKIWRVGMGLRVDGWVGG